MVARPKEARMEDVVDEYLMQQMLVMQSVGGGS